MSFSRGAVILGVMMGNEERKKKSFFFQTENKFSQQRVEKRGDFMTLHENQELLWRDSDFLHRV